MSETDASTEECDEPRLSEIRIKGHLDKGWTEWFDGRPISREANGNRLLTGSVVWWEAVLLVVGGFAAGFINANAGGASVLTVPLLVLAGVPGNSANASNRVGIFTSSLAAATAFRRLGVRGLRSQVHILVPIVVGSLRLTHVPVQ